MKSLAVIFKGETVFEYNRDVVMEDRQLEYLDKMDRGMDGGIKIRGELLSKPDCRQRATFVAMNLVKALQQNNDAIISASCAYLVKRMPKLVQIEVSESDNTVNIDLIEETE